MKRLFFLLFLLLLSLGLLRPGWWHRAVVLVEEWEQAKEDEEPGEIPDSRVGISYVLDAKRWTTYPLPPVGEVIRSLSRANFHPDVSTLSEQGEAYALEYQVLDGEGRILRSRLYHYRVSRIHYVDRETGEPFRFTFYPDSGLIPSPATAVMIPLAGLEGRDRIRYRVAEKTSAIADISLQLYAPERPAERKLRYLWHRFSEEKRMRMARGNVYPAALLTEAERRNLLLNFRRPLSPMGVEGIDYDRRLLYIVKDTENIEEQMDEPVPPQGLFIGPGFKGVIPIPEGGGRLRLVFSPPIPRTGLSSMGDIRIRWFGLRPHARRSFRWPLGRGIQDPHFDANLPGGTVEIQSPVPLVVRAFLMTGEETREITPEPLIIEGFLLGPSMPVSFPIHHIRTRRTPFRADFRFLPVHPIPITVRYAVENGKGEVIETGRMEVAGEISPYDRIAGETADMRVSEPVSRYFSLPPTADTLRFTADHPVLVTAYNRPPGQIKTTRAPEDYFKIEFTERIRQPSWFSLHPEGYDRLLVTGRVLHLTIQPRPPEDRPLLAAGRYEWEDFHPEGDWRARYLLTPRDKDQAVRPEALDVLYRVLPVGETAALRFAGVPGMKRLRPRLIYEKKTDGPAVLTLHLDGTPHFTTRIAGKRGEISLPPVGAGLHRVRMDAEPDGLRLYINHVVDFAGRSGGATYLKRLANYLGPEGLRFVYPKEDGGKRLLSLRLYVPQGKKDPSVLRVRVKGKRSGTMGPFPEWSLLDRRFVLRPNPEKKVPVLGTEDRYVDGGRLFFLGLGEDLSPGAYPLKIEPTGDFEGGYLILSQVTPGLFEKRDWHQEATERKW